MRKDNLIKTINSAKKNNELSTILLREFINTKQIRKKNYGEIVLFWEFLYFLKKRNPDAIISIGKMLNKPTCPRELAFLDSLRDVYQTRNEQRSVKIFDEFLGVESQCPKFFDQELWFGGDFTSHRYNSFLVEIAGWACFEFRKGTKQFKNPDVSLFCKLPRDVIKLIFAYVFPMQNMTVELLVNDKKQRVFLRDEFAKRIYELKFFNNDHRADHVQEVSQKKSHKNCNVM